MHLKYLFLPLIALVLAGLAGITPFAQAATVVLLTLNGQSANITIASGQSVTVAWGSSGDSCSGNGTDGSGDSSGSFVATPTVTTTYSVSCSTSEDGSAGSKSRTVTVTSGPWATLSGTNAAVDNPATLTWSSGGASSCTGTNFSTGGATSGTVTVIPTTDTTYSVTCDSATSGSVVITAATIPTLSASPATLTVGSNALLTWSALNASSCAGTDFNTNNALSGSVSVTPTTTTTYSITCSGISKSTTVSVVPPVSVSASAISVVQYATTTITWSSVGADYCVGDDVITNGATSGSTEVYPTETTTFSVECYDYSTTSGPSTWQSGGSDYSDYWCNAAPNGEGVILPQGKTLGNSCDASVSEGAACTAPSFCSISSVAASCGVSSEFYYCESSGSYVPTGSASVMVTVNGAPTTPTFTTPGLTCPASVTAGSSASFTLSASDPDGDQIHYGIDWDDDSAVDQWKTGTSTYVASGVSQSFSYTWSNAGTYAVKGIAEDTGAHQSAWASCTVTVTAVPPPQCNNGTNDDGDSYGTDYPADPGCTSLTDTTESPNPECSDGTDNDSDGLGDTADPGCHSDGNPDNPATFGPSNPLESATPPGSPECSNGEDDDYNGVTDWNSNPSLSDIGCSGPLDTAESTPPPGFSISVSPGDRIRSQTQATITWSTTNVEPGTCSVTGDNTPADQWTGDSGSEQTAVLTNQTVYTLRCLDLAGNASSTTKIIRIAPTSGEQ